jgi:hypothetical protein
MIDLDVAVPALNFLGLVLFLILLGAILFSMSRRVIDYRHAKEPLPSILKRGVALFGALAILGGEALIMRVLGIELGENTTERFIYLTQFNIILLGAMGYYAKVELLDIDRPDRP